MRRCWSAWRDAAVNAANLQKADLHVSKAAVHSMTAADGLLVEMPPGFDVAGDTGSIGRFNAMSDGTNASVEMDIKGDIRPSYIIGGTHCACRICAAEFTVLGNFRIYIEP